MHTTGDISRPNKASTIEATKLLEYLPVGIRTLYSAGTRQGDKEFKCLDSQLYVVQKAITISISSHREILYVRTRANGAITMLCELILAKLY